MAFTTLVGFISLAIIAQAASAKADLLSELGLQARSDLTTCKAIAAAISDASSVYYPGKSVALAL